MEKVIIISGPTASGKSHLAHSIYESSNNFCVVNADSMQIYKELPILTAQPEYDKYPDYKLYGVLSYDQVCSVAYWLDQVKAVLRECWDNNKIPIIVGGTGLYIKSLIHGLSNLPDISPEVRAEVATKFSQLGANDFHRLLAIYDQKSADRIHINDSYRMIRAMEIFTQTGRTMDCFYANEKDHVEFDLLHITLIPERKELHKVCNERFSVMIDAGALEEVKMLKALENSSVSLLSKALGYKDLCSYLEGDITLENAMELAQAQTRQYAKRQITWFKNQAPEAVRLEYCEFNAALNEAMELVRKFTH